jgi:hypothetical protein
VSKYFVAPPRADDGSDLIYRAITSFGDTVAGTINSITERKRRAAEQAKADEFTRAKLAQDGIYEAGHVPTPVVAQDDSVRAAVANLIGGPGAGAGFRPEQFADPDLGHAHAMQQVGRFMVAPHMRESHQDDDRRKVETITKDRNDARNDLTRLRSSGATLPTGFDPNTRDVSSLRTAIATMAGEQDRIKAERAAEDQEFQRQNMVASREAAARAERNTARYEAEAAERRRRDTDRDAREARIGRLAHGRRHLRNDPNAIHRELTAEDKRLGISSGDVVNRIDQDYGGSKNGASSDPQAKAYSHVLELGKTHKRPANQGGRPNWSAALKQLDEEHANKVIDTDTYTRAKALIQAKLNQTKKSTKK